MRKICVITGTRADYGLLFWVMKAIKKEPELHLQLIATGMHLSTEFGLTYKQIEKDGFVIDKKLEILLASDTTVGISKSMGLGMIAFSEAFNELKSDIVLVLGDRYEIFGASIAAAILGIKIAHIHGGEVTEGALDEFMRHSITKMSSLHFTTHVDYSQRVQRLGENPKAIFNVGGLGAENVELLKKPK